VRPIGVEAVARAMLHAAEHAGPGVTRLGSARMQAFATR
jgi:hypothetical protein